MTPTVIGKASLYNVDCRDLLASLPDNCMDSIVTDPPYELGFMGKSWDSSGIAYNVDMWREAMRVLKPGGHLLAFGHARTYHRLAVAIEDAGFEIRDQIMWVYGSGYPKSLNLDGEWEGWGTGLKPAHEPICMARKPLIGTVAQNIAKYGVGALNIEACRIETADTLRAGSGGIPIRHNENEPRKRKGEASADRTYQNNGGTDFRMKPGPRSDTQGRWPANFVHDGSDEVVELFPAEAGAFAPVRGTEPSASTKSTFGQINRMKSNAFHGDQGSAARFFYCAKTTQQDRDEGLYGFSVKAAGIVNDSGRSFSARDPMRKIMRSNTHPTVKPTALCRWLIKMVTPPQGKVLDLFMGSGSTGKAAALDGFTYYGVDDDIKNGYFDIAKARIAHAACEPIPDIEPEEEAIGQQGLFA
jgi:DNA modification methylase